MTDTTAPLSVYVAQWNDGMITGDESPPTDYDSKHNLEWCELYQLAPPPVDVPTVPGWYWMRVKLRYSKATWQPVEVYRVRDTDALVYGSGWPAALRLRGTHEWRGPIQPPGGE